MRTDPFRYFNEAIETAFEAAALPVVLALGFLFLLVVLWEARTHVRWPDLRRRLRNGSGRQSAVGSERRRVGVVG